MHSDKNWGKCIEMDESVVNAFSSKNITNNEMYQMFSDIVEQNKGNPVTNNVDISLYKSDNNWKMIMDGELLNALSGNLLNDTILWNDKVDELHRSDKNEITYTFDNSGRISEGEYWCMGKNDTCQNKTSDPGVFFCEECDRNRDNVEDIKQ